MARFAIINQEYVVVNCVEWEGGEWLPPRNHYVVPSAVADIGDIWDKEKNIFSKKSE